MHYITTERNAPFGEHLLSKLPGNTMTANIFQPGGKVLQCLHRALLTELNLYSWLKATTLQTLTTRQNTITIMYTIACLCKVNKSWLITFGSAYVTCSTRISHFDI